MNAHLKIIQLQFRMIQFGGNAKHSQQIIRVLLMSREKFLECSQLHSEVLQCEVPLHQDGVPVTLVGLGYRRRG